MEAKVIPLREETPVEQARLRQAAQIELMQLAFEHLQGESAPFGLEEDAPPVTGDVLADRLRKCSQHDGWLLTERWQRHTVDAAERALIYLLGVADPDARLYWAPFAARVLHQEFRMCDCGVEIVWVVANRGGVTRTFCIRDLMRYIATLVDEKRCERCGAKDDEFFVGLCEACYVEDADEARVEQVADDLAMFSFNQAVR